MTNISKKNRNNLDIILREVFSVDTKAGYRLRYMITKALACPNFGAEINLLPYVCYLDQLMDWSRTSEGHDYWSYVNKLIKRSRCG
jgi:hypothetical protein